MPATRAPAPTSAPCGGVRPEAPPPRAELGRINRDLDRLVQALLDGAPARTVKDRMAQLEARQEVLETQLAQGEDANVAMHPSMADHYRERVANLREALAREGCQAEAA